MRLQLVILTILAVLVAGIAPLSGYAGSPPFFSSAHYDQNFPDPHVILVGDTYYAYATNTGGPQIPSMTSTDLENWKSHHRWGPEVGDTSLFQNDLLVQNPSWAPSGHFEVWAPAVVQLASGWRAYYGIQSTKTSRPTFCITVATGPGPLGPFRDTSDGPITCGYGTAGAIDPWVHVDASGTPFLLWKMEPYSATEIEDDDRHFPLDPEVKTRGPKDPLRVLPASPSAIWAQELDPSGLELAEEAWASTLLVGGGASWERGSVENPAMFTANGKLHLFYSGNRWGSPDYATGWATCSTPLGPCWRAQSTPILAKSATENGPGGASVFVDRNGEHHVAYHAWNPPYAHYPSYPACDTDNNQICADEGQRFMHIQVLCTIPGGALAVGVPDGWDFCDTDGASWRGPGVAWLNAEGVTTGVSPHYFAPDRTITRAEMVTLLWRWAGNPAPATPAPFTDILTDAFYSDAVAWAAETGIVRGTSPTTFAPHDPINRAQVATILHRAAGSPALVDPNPFTDVEAEQYFTEPVQWLAEVEITTGTTSTEFAPLDPSTRAQFATMLCRNSRLDLVETALVTSPLPACP